MGAAWGSSQESRAKMMAWIGAMADRDSGYASETEPTIDWQLAGGVAEGRVQRDSWAEHADAQAAID